MNKAAKIKMCGAVAMAVEQSAPKYSSKEKYHKYTYTHICIYIFSYIKFTYIDMKNIRINAVCAAYSACCMQR